MAHQEQQPIIIGVVGMTGVGKTTFIKTLTKDPNVAVGASLQEVHCSTMRYKSCEVTLVDTPGFDGIGRVDTEILLKLAAWLGSQRQQVKLAGLIYMHRITDNQLGSFATENIRPVRALVGENNMRNAVLVTNRWEEIMSKERGEEVLQKVIGPGPPAGFWYQMATQEASYAMHDGSEQSALEVVRLIVERSPAYLHIQEKLHAWPGASQTAQAFIGELHRNSKQLRTKLEIVQGRLVKANEQNDKLQGKLVEAEERNTELQGKLVETEKRNAELREQLSIVDKLHIEAINRLVEADEKYAKLRREAEEKNFEWLKKPAAIEQNATESSSSKWDNLYEQQELWEMLASLSKYKEDNRRAGKGSWEWIPFLGK